MESDNELKGNGNSYDFGARIYDPRLGRWLSLDPLANTNSNISPYSAFENSPIFFVDNDGKDGVAYLIEINGEKTLVIKATYITEGIVTKELSDKIHSLLNINEKVEFKGQEVNVKFEISFKTVLEVNPQREFEKDVAPGFMPRIIKTNDDGLAPRLGVNELRFSVNNPTSTGEGNKDLIGINIAQISKDAIDQGSLTNGAASTIVHEIGHNIGFLHDDGSIMDYQTVRNGKFITNPLTKEALQNFVNRIAEMSSASGPQDYWKNKGLSETEGSPGITKLLNDNDRKQSNTKEEVDPVENVQPAKKNK